MIRIKAVGDIMPGGILTGTDCEFYTERVEHFLSEADFRIGTLECGIGNEPSYSKEKLKSSSAFVYAKDRDLVRLKQIGINAVSLANNHFFDLGVDGALHAMTLLEELGICFFGAGRNLEEAEKPLVFEWDGETVAFLGFCDTKLRWVQFATSDTPGVNPMELNHVIDSIQRAKTNYDYVVAVMHWGKEHTWWPIPYVIEMANKMRDAGASLIIGDHPHRIQPLIRIKNCPAVFSLGNFLFPDRIINIPYVTYYSDDITDYGSLPKVKGFVRVNEPSLKMWPSVSNVGMVLDAIFEKDRTDVRYELTRITRDGRISFVSEKRHYRIILSFVSIVMQIPFYHHLYTSCEFFARGFSRVKSFLIKMCHAIIEMVVRKSSVRSRV